MTIQRLVPSFSKVKDKATMDELNNIYNQITVLLDAIRILQAKIDELESK